MSFFLQTVQVIGEHTAEIGAQVANHVEHTEHTKHGTAHAANWVTLLAKSVGDDTIPGYLLLQGEKIIFSAIVIFLIIFACRKANLRMKFLPEKPELFLESIIESLDELVCSIMGPRGRVHTPFVGALFIYILTSNLYGLLPLQNSSTASVTTTAALGIAVFVYVQIVGITKNGLIGYIKHLAGSPNDIMGYVLIPINLPLHILGEFTKPLTLMFRLYGNMMAGHILIATFLMMGINVLKSYNIPFGIPIHLPFLFLEILVSLIQAFVFALLSAIYIGSILPHEHEHHPHEHDHHPNQELELLEELTTTNVMTDVK